MSSISVQQALKLIDETAVPLAPRTLPLHLAIGHTMAEDVRAAIDQPPFPRSPLDGYALRHEDSRGASNEHPVRLKVSAYYAAGAHADTPIAPGTAVRIMTGGMIPPGADCVIRQEDTQEQAGIVSLFTELNALQNYVPRGDDFTAGTMLLHKGLPLDAAALAIAAAAGLDSLRVMPRPCLSLISTGDELCQPGEALLPAHIYDANVTYLRARATQLGLAVANTASAGDDVDAICAAITEGMDKADVVLTSGGISVGDKDLLPDALQKLGARVVFHGVAMKPGMPTLLAILDGKPIMGLSGNPFAAAVAFEVLARPLLSRLADSRDLLPRQATAVLTNSFDRPTKVRRFLRARLQGGQVTLPTGHANGNLFSMIGCNCLVDTQHRQDPPKAGDKVEVWML